MIMKQNKSLKVLLCVPMNRKFSKWVTVVNLNDSGLGYLETACKRSDSEVTLLSWNYNLNKEEFKKKLEEIQPDIVGIKVFTTLFNSAIDSLICVRETLPDAITIIGGPHPSTSKPEDLFIEFEGLIDYAVAGDGEHAISEIIKLIKKEKVKLNAAKLRNIGGLIYKDNNKIQSNPPKLDANLDYLDPIDWSSQNPSWFGTSHGLDNESKGVLLLDSRGCPAKCGFCNCYMINGLHPRKRSLNNLCSEIDELVHKYGVRAFVFTGNSFLSDVDYLKELCNWLTKFDTKIKWSCTGAAFDSNLLKPNLLNLMHDAGCSLIHFGIESGNQKVRNRINQPISLKETTEIVKLTSKTGIRPACYFMFGFPDETVQEINDTIKYSLSIPAFSISFTTCLPLPGTLCYTATLKKYGLKRIDWSTYNFSFPKLLPCKTSYLQIREKLFEVKLLKKSRLAKQIFQFLY